MADTWQLDVHTVNAYCYYNGAFNTNTLDTIIRIGDSLNLGDAQVGGDFSNPGGINENIRKTSIGWFPIREDTEQIYRGITDLIKQANDKWFGFDLNYIEALQYSIYNVGDFYDAHVDHHYQGSGQYPRKLSFTLQLTDPSEYEGGETLLITSQDPFPIPKERGTITFFPSYTLHEVKPITKGTRKALVGWIHGPRLK